MYKLIRQIPLPTDIQNIILDYCIPHKKRWSKYWLDISLKYIHIFKYNRRLAYFTTERAIYGMNANLEFFFLENKLNVIRELQNKYKIEPLNIDSDDES